MGQEISATVAKLGAGEKLAVLGAAAVLAVWLVFDLLIDEYSIGTFSFVLSLVIVYAAYRHHNRGSDHWTTPYGSVVWAPPRCWACSVSGSSSKRSAGTFSMPMPQPSSGVWRSMSPRSSVASAPIR